MRRVIVVEGMACYTKCIYISSRCRFMEKATTVDSFFVLGLLLVSCVCTAVALFNLPSE